MRRMELDPDSRHDVEFLGYSCGEDEGWMVEFHIDQEFKKNSCYLSRRKGVRNRHGRKEAEATINGGSNAGADHERREEMSYDLRTPHGD
ncbi:hypothetical protein DH2020_007609 [Rehmannia glutinosa]|uniref:Uncharacterized protein n=1 Tax=Rehmannia glutinosa TaxID=99300 RepID=A0ABR0TYL0_REHGL